MLGNAPCVRCKPRVASLCGGGPDLLEIRSPYFLASKFHLRAIPLHAPFARLLRRCGGEREVEGA
jgi:hypothetical protein